MRPTTTFRLLRRQRGMEALQSVLILGVAFVVLLGLRQIYLTVAAPGLAEQATVLLRANGRGAAAKGAEKGPPAPPAPARAADAPAPPPNVNIRSAPRAEALRVPRAADVALGRDVVALAGQRFRGAAVADGDRPTLDRLAEKYHIRRVDVSDAGVEAMILTPKDPADTRVILALGATGDWSELPTDAPVERRTAPAGGDGPAKQYAAALSLARELVAEHGGANVVAVGYSAGGGLATYAGAMLGIRALAYNAVPLRPDALEQVRRSGAAGAEQNVTQVRVAGAGAPGGAGEEFGEVVTVRGAATGLMAFALNHLLDNFALDDPVSVTPARPLPR